MVLLESAVETCTWALGVLAKQGPARGLTGARTCIRRCLDARPTSVSV